MFQTWAEAEKLVKGFAGARYKKFPTRPLAEAFAQGDMSVAGSKDRPSKSASRSGGARAAAPPFGARPRGVTAVYTDGGCRGNQGVDANKTQPAGWGFVAVRDGTVLAERWGPVELGRASPHFLGAEKCSNNTGELSAIGEALLWLRDEDATTSAAVICYDSKYAANVTNGTYQAHKNVELATTCRRLYASELVRRTRQLTFQHVKGHSGDVMNDRADELVQRGVNGGRSGRGADAPPPESAGGDAEDTARRAEPLDDATRDKIEQKRLAAVELRNKKKRAGADSGSAAPKESKRSKPDVIDLT